MKNKSVSGFTLVELLVVIAIIGVLVATTFPAIQASREMGRRSQCRANLAQLALALQDYENAFESFPPGVTNPDGPIRSEAKGQHWGWIARLLPYLEEGNASRLIDPAAGAYGSANAPVHALSLPVLICPTEPNDQRATSNYAGCHHDVEAPIDADNHGVLFLNSHVRRADITDGVSHTLLLGEKRIDPDDLGWMSGTRATLRNTGLALNDVVPLATENAADSANQPQGVAAGQPALTYVGPFGSAHVSGAFMGFADGRVKYVVDDIDLQVWRQLGHRADGKLLNFDVTE